jgi:hypothetical protein
MAPNFYIFLRGIDLRPAGVLYQVGLTLFAPRWRIPRRELAANEDKPPA